MCSVDQRCDDTQSAEPNRITGNSIETFTRENKVSHLEVYCLFCRVITIQRVCLGVHSVIDSFVPDSRHVTHVWKLFCFLVLRIGGLSVKV